MARLRSEVQALREISLTVLTAATSDPPTQPFEMLAGRTSPRRAAAIAREQQPAALGRPSDEPFVAWIHHDRRFRQGVEIHHDDVTLPGRLQRSDDMRQQVRVANRHQDAAPPRLRSISRSRLA